MTSARRSVVSSLLLIVPALWLGLVLALSFIETPLKFTVEGMQLPVALGLGRLVFTASNIAGFVLLAAITALALIPPRRGRGVLAVVGGLWVVLLVQVLAIRPPLNARSDIIVAGGDPGDSPLHVLYAGADGVIAVLLVVLIVLGMRVPFDSPSALSLIHI